MKNLFAFKYLLVLTLPVAVAISFTRTGWLTFLPVIHAFVLIPLLELMIKPNAKNLDASERALRSENPLYDWMLYLIVPVQLVFLLWYLAVFQADSEWVSRIGHLTGMGMLCGVLGINVAHELGHRTTKYEQFMAKILLATSLYMHFFIEHNRGHHKNVSTPEDPSSARINEWLPMFWIRSISGAYLGAFRLETQRLSRQKKAVFSLRNEMLIFQIVQVVLLICIAYFFGVVVMLGFLGSAFFGILLLETVNYIEHYGLVRKKVSAYRYADAAPEHSWNSNHVMGRLLLFELSRHSDHHYQPSKKYQLLDNYAESPQMPTGYPGMMLLATIPPLWFFIMNPRVHQWQHGDLNL